MLQARIEDREIGIDVMTTIDADMTNAAQKLAEKAMVAAGMETPEWSGESAQFIQQDQRSGDIRIITVNYADRPTMPCKITLSRIIQ